MRGARRTAMSELALDVAAERINDYLGGTK
jgi:hypothetical protein